MKIFNALDYQYIVIATDPGYGIEIALVNSYELCLP